MPGRLLRYRRFFVVWLHLTLIVAASYAAFLLRFDGAIPASQVALWWQTLPWLVVIQATTFLPFRLYEGMWRYASIWDLRNIILGVTTSSAVSYVAFRWYLGAPTYPRSVLVIDALLLILGMGGVRLGRRLYRELSPLEKGRRMLIFGAGDAGEMIVRDMRNNAHHHYEPIGFVDDDRRKSGARIHGVPVLGTRRELSRIIETHQPREVLVAMPSASAAIVREIVRALEPYKIPIRTLPNLRDILDGQLRVGQIRSLKVEDLLARAPVDIEDKSGRELIAGRRVMVTGAGGSIGSELCRQIAHLSPASLVMFERYENSLHAIRLELDDRQYPFAVVPVVGDVTDAVRVNAVLETYRPEIVFHAAAHKHVPLMEENPCEAIKNNVGGTRVMARAAEVHGVNRFIMISTDKAANPTSVMGASKRVAELLVQAQAEGSGTSYATVRFGNVLGSNGSVVPRFMEQIAKGGPVTVTHPDVRRFFMLIPEAVQLVLHAAAAHAQNGAILVLEMGEQVKLVDLARDLIRLSGLVPNDDIKIKFTGLRQGEKLSEELLGANEELGPSGVEKVLSVKSLAKVTPDLLARIVALETAAAEGRAEMVRAALKDLVGPKDG